MGGLPRLNGGLEILIAIFPEVTFILIVMNSPNCDDESAPTPPDPRREADAKRADSNETPPEGLPSVRGGDIPAATANRLGLYLRELQHFLRAGTETIKSNSLGNRLGLSDSQIRRDLALFGEFGKRGVGYNVAGLVGALRQALGTDGQWNTILIGLGNLGNALVRYRGFEHQGFSLKAIFEQNPEKVGNSINGVCVYSIGELEERVPSLGVQMAILAVPAEPAPALARRLADLGVAGILNFAPVSLPIDKSVSIVDVDLAVELQRLAFAVVNSGNSS